jgi:hypothetical protein
LLNFNKGRKAGVGKKNFALLTFNPLPHIPPVKKEGTGKY